MKNLFSLIFLLFISNCIGQTMDHVVFDYDNAGNQIKRYLIDIDPGKQSMQPVKDIEDIVNSDLIKADIYDDLKYYPNPVREELYLKWDFTEDVKVQSIALYSLSGQLIKMVKDVGNVTSYTFPFQELPQAIYNLVLNCSNGEQRSLKIVKH
jgi:hypothetical protein